MGKALVAFAVLSAKGVPYGAKPINDPGFAQQTKQMGGTVVARSVDPGDCPHFGLEPRLAAHIHFLGISPYLSAMGPVDYWEPVNECSWPSQEWLNEFALAMIEITSERGIPIVFPSDGPGRPEIGAIDYQVEWLLALLDAGGCYGAHAYGVTPGVRLIDSGPWLGYRHRRLHARMVALDSRLADLPFCLTEVASGGSPPAPDVEDFTLYYASLLPDTHVRYVALWTAGDAPPYSLANLNGYMAEIALVLHTCEK